MSSFTTPQSSTVVTPNTTVWKLDAAHTLVEFSAKHMMISTVKGQFKKIDATVQWDEQDVTNSSVEATIDASSLVTGQDMRDNHLRSQDFLHPFFPPAFFFALHCKHTPVLSPSLLNTMVVAPGIHNPAPPVLSCSGK